MEQMIAAFLGGSAASALISGLFSLLQDRLRHLRPMYRDCRAIARYLEHYYDRREGAYGAGPHQSAHLSAQQ